MRKKEEAFFRFGPEWHTDGAKCKGDPGTSGKSQLGKQTLSASREEGGLLAFFSERRATDIGKSVNCVPRKLQSGRQKSTS